MTMNGNDDGKCDNYKAMLMVMVMLKTCEGAKTETMTKMKTHTTTV